MYSNAKPVIVTNAAAYTSLTVTEAMYDPIHRRSNITMVDNVEKLPTTSSGKKP